MKENIFYGAGPLIFRRAEELRNSMTSAERIVWKHIHINEWKLKFRRKHPIANFIADFYCHQLKLVIEIDGDIHDVEEGKQYDKAREETLKRLGLTVVRIKNDEVYKNSDKVLKQIDNIIRKLQSPPLGDGGKLYVIKIGGKIINDEVALSSFLKDFSSVKGNKILIHGGGSMATKLATQLGINQKLINGRRVTDAETLKVVTMVYAGYINKNIVAHLQALGCNAFGLTGADGNSILAHKRITQVSPSSENQIDYGYAGDIDEINVELLTTLLHQKISLVIAPITHDGKGQLLNTNADTIAQEIATSLAEIFDVQLLYMFEKKGVLADASDESAIIKELTATNYKSYKKEGIISNGMIPKLDNAFTALDKGVKRVMIGHSEHLKEIIAGTSGTSIQK